MFYPQYLQYDLWPICSRSRWHNCFIPLVILCVFYTGVHEYRQWPLGGILSTLEISDHLQQSASLRIALQLFKYGSTEFYLRLGLMMPFKVFPSLIFICPTSAHCKHTVTHPSSGVLVKIKAQISGKQTPHLRPVTHANNTAKHNIQCAHTDTHTALTDWWLFRDFIHQKEYNLFQTHMRKCSCCGGASVYRSLLSVYQSINITEHFTLAESSRVTLLDFNYFGLVNSWGGQSMTENKHMLLGRVLFLITAGGSNQLELWEIYPVFLPCCKWTNVEGAHEGHPPQPVMCI